MIVRFLHWVALVDCHAPDEPQHPLLGAGVHRLLDRVEAGQEAGEDR